jgi:hypothetical protein
MGRDLTVCPLRSPGHATPPVLLYDRLRLIRNYSLFDVILTFPSQPLPEGEGGRREAMIYEDDGILTVATDKYGEALRWVRAAEFHDDRLDGVETGEWNRALIGFLRALPPETMVVLYWD